MLLGECTVADAVVTVPDGPTLAVLPSGPVLPNPSEMLLRRYAKLITTLRAESDYVLIDSPPVLPVADALIVSAVADIVLVVVWANRTAEKQLRRAVELLPQVDANSVGTVLNGILRRGDDSMSYGYRYGYVATQHPGKRRRRRRHAAQTLRSSGPGQDKEQALTGS